MNSELRQGVQDAAKEALHIVRGYFMGDEKEKGKVSDAVRVIGLGVKVEHMDQNLGQGNKSFALRLLPFLKDEQSRNEYIKITNPEIEHLIVSRPRIALTSKGGKSNGR